MVEETQRQVEALNKQLEDIQKQIEDAYVTYANQSQEWVARKIAVLQSRAAELQEQIEAYAKKAEERVNAWVDEQKKKVQDAIEEQLTAIANDKMELEKARMEEEAKNAL